MRALGLGVDLIEISRFLSRGGKKTAYLEKLFTKDELAYCFSFKDSRPHLAGIFAAKEAVIKASGGNLNIFDVEIRRRKNGQPEVFIKNKRVAQFLVSISHTDTLACAIAIKL